MQRGPKKNKLNVSAKKLSKVTAFAFGAVSPKDRLRQCCCFSPSTFDETITFLPPQLWQIEIKWQLTLEKDSVDPCKEGLNLLSILKTFMFI